MKHNQSRLFSVLAVPALIACLFSFALVSPGGESYTIFLNDKLVIEHYQHSKAALPSLSLAGVNANDRLSIYYNECGKIGTSRKLSVRDQAGKVLQEWRFNDATNEHTPLTCKAGDLQLLAREAGTKMTLFYTSREASQPRPLATVTLDSNTKGLSGL